MDKKQPFDEKKAKERGLIARALRRYIGDNYEEAASKCFFNRRLWQSCEQGKKLFPDNVIVLYAVLHDIDYLPFLDSERVEEWSKLWSDLPLRDKGLKKVDPKTIIEDPTFHLND